MRARRVTLWAGWLRKRFDRLAARFGGVSVVTVFAVVTVLTGSVQQHMLQQGAVCSPLPISLFRLEVTFSVSRFFSMLNGVCDCAGNISQSLIIWDQLFAPSYGAFLCALYLWTERWRRFDVNDRPRDVVGSVRRDFIVVAPLAAAVLDMVVENLNLWYATHYFVYGPSTVVSSAPSLVAVAVIVGSTGALLKWLLLLLTVAALGGELLSGPRGSILRRARFSVLAVALGAVPLLAVPQGQDVLQRLVEDVHVAWALLAAVPPLVFAAFAVWYFGRKLIELSLDPTPADTGGWFEFFGEQIPRMLGVAALILPGLAFATAADRPPTAYLAFGGAGFFVAFFARRFFPKALGRFGSALLPRSWRTIPGLDQRLAQCVLASTVAIVAMVIIEAIAFTPPLPTLYLRRAAYLCYVAAWFFQLFVEFRRAAWNATPRRAGVSLAARPPIDKVELHDIGRGLKIGTAVAATVSVAFFVAFTAKPVPVGRWLGPLWILCLAVVNAVFFGSVSMWASRRFRIPIVPAALALALLFSAWNDSHTVLPFGGDAADTIDKRRTVEEQFSAWSESHARDNPKGPVVLVASQGGGLRAAYWAAISLAAIEDASRQSLADKSQAFAHHVFAFSGVSGGSLGGALFASLVRDLGDEADNTLCTEGRKELKLRAVTSGLYARCVHDFMHDDFLTPLLAKLVAPDFLQLFLPFPVDAFDRSRGLEQSWEESYSRVTAHSTFESGFLSFVSADHSPVPVLILNSTHVETGRRYMASSVFRDRDAQEHGRPFQDAGDVLTILGKDMRLSTAVHNSARFPYVSPAGHLDAGDGEEHGAIVDGGYFENSGLATLREVYLILKRKGVNPYVLYLCNDPKSCDPPPDESLRPTAASELVSPVLTLLKTRDARGSLAQTSLQGLAGKRFLQMNVCRDLPARMLASGDTKADTLEEKDGENEEAKAKAKPRVVSPPLGWLLSALARDWMDASLEGTKDDPSCYGRNAMVIDTLSRVMKGETVVPGTD
jgi:hypothetical protein